MEYETVLRLIGEPLTLPREQHLALKQSLVSNQQEGVSKCAHSEDYKLNDLYAYNLVVLRNYNVS